MSSTITSKLKTFSLTHLVSIVAILIAVLGVNAIYFAEAQASGALIGLFSGSGIMWLTFFDLSAVAGMSFYSYRVAASASGLTVETIPSTPTPAAQSSTVSLDATSIQQIASALKSATSNTSTSAPTSG